MERSTVWLWITVNLVNLLIQWDLACLTAQTIYYFHYSQQWQYIIIIIIIIIIFIKLIYAWQQWCIIEEWPISFELTITIQVKSGHKYQFKARKHSVLTKVRLTRPYILAASDCLIKLKIISFWLYFCIIDKFYIFLMI